MTIFVLPIIGEDKLFIFYFTKFGCLFVVHA